MDADPRDIRRAARLFKALSHPGRLRVVCSLMGGRSTTQKDLIRELRLPQSTVNRHLSRLREIGLVTARQDGSKVVLELQSSVTNNLMRALCDWTNPETGEAMSDVLRKQFRDEERISSGIALAEGIH